MTRDDIVPVAFLVLVVGLLVVLVFTLIKYDRERDKKVAAACAHMKEAARTSADTMKMIELCEYPAEDKNTHVVYPVVIPVR